MKLNKFIRKYWLIILGVIILIFILFPKPCGEGYVNLTTHIRYSKDCECFGRKISSPTVDVWSYSCIGICSSCRCYQSNLLTEEVIEVSCD